MKTVLEIRNFIKKVSGNFPAPEMCYVISDLTKLPPRCLNLLFQDLYNDSIIQTSSLNGHAIIVQNAIWKFGLKFVTTFDIWPRTDLMSLLTLSKINELARRHIF